jgi:hypothetical protein
MPAKSKAQYGLMAGVMSGSIKGSGIPPSTAREFVEKTPAKKRSFFAKHLRSSKSKKKDKK